MPAAPAMSGTVSGGIADTAGFLEANRQSNMQFLQLQSSVAQETQQYMTMSQVMKARDDAAKNTIHNT
jgi:hypothetical protein